MWELEGEREMNAVISDDVPSLRVVNYVIPITSATDPDTWASHAIIRSDRRQADRHNFLRRF